MALLGWIPRCKDDNLIEWEDWRFIFILGGPLDVLEVFDNEKGVLKKECVREMCRVSQKCTRKSNQDIKEWWWHHNTCSFSAS